jgi:hypothetical protein
MVPCERGKWLNLDGTGDPFARRMFFLECQRIEWPLICSFPCEQFIRIEEINLNSSQALSSKDQSPSFRMKVENQSLNSD